MDPGIAAATTRPSDASVSGLPSQSVMTPPAPSTTGTRAIIVSLEIGFDNDVG